MRARPEVDGDAIAAATWYHTIDLPGTTTPGRYDLRPVVTRLPFPDLRGARCIDVGSRDGFFAFEMERRGAAEVVSLDISEPAKIDFPTFRPQDEIVQQDLDNGDAAFHLAASALGSSVKRRFCSAYELDPDDIGTFDFAMIGTLLLHLRDPVRALQGVRRVLNGTLLVNEAITPSLDIVRRRPIAEMLMFPGLPFWWLANPAGIRKLIDAGGFEVVQSGRPYMVRNGRGASNVTLSEALRGPIGDAPRRLIERRGDPHVWFVARPLPD
jgi:tRNA (mo5U34)-methyltransferase